MWNCTSLFDSGCSVVGTKTSASHLQMYCCALQSHIPLTWPQTDSFLVHINGSNLHWWRFLNLHDASGVFFSESDFSVHERLLVDVSSFPSWDKTVAQPFMNTSCSLRSSSVDWLSWTPQAFSLQRLSSGAEEIYLTSTHQQSITTY